MSGATDPAMPGPVSTRVAVVIAFFQRQPKLLLNAIRSVLDQSAGEIHIIVVDDGSPIRASDELVELSSAERARLHLVEQPNAGPGAARNRGLAEIPAGIEYVAFLDSDDIWTPDHIKRALDAFALGADFYFTDYVPLNSDRSTFSICGMRPEEMSPPDHEGVFAYQGDMFDALLHRSPVGTSTVVYRRTLGHGCAFPTRFRYCEDVFFWMQLVRNARKIMFSDRPGAIYGPGVNIAAGATWGTSSSLMRLYGDFLFHLTVAQTFHLTPAQRRWSSDWRREVSRTFIKTLLHLVRHRKPVELRYVLRFVAMNPALLVSLVPRRAVSGRVGAAANLEAPQ